MNPVNVETCTPGTRVAEARHRGDRRTESFPIGYYQLHPDICINFQLNPFYGWAGDDSRLTEMRDGMVGVSDYPMFTKIILELGEKALVRNLDGKRFTNKALSLLDLNAWVSRASAESPDTV